MQASDGRAGSDCGVDEETGRGTEKISRGNGLFADIIVDIKHEKLDQLFQYRIPEWLKEELNVGMEVVIPFGKGNRQTKGYVVGISETCRYMIFQSQGRSKIFPETV